MDDKKVGFPQESEIVICTVTNIQYNSVFVKLDEYKNLQGMIHISEISPGRIRNLRDFVKEGKVIVCKILRINRERGHIDLSLRRVNESQRRKKLESIKLNQKAEKIVEFASKHLKNDYKEFLNEVSEKVKAVGYESLYSCFEDVVENDYDITEIGLEEESSKVLDEQIRQKIKPASVRIEGIMTLNSYLTNGIEIVKEALIAADATDDAVQIYYGGGGHFKTSVEAPDYKTAEKILGNALKVAEDHMTKTGGDFKFVRKENKK